MYYIYSLVLESKLFHGSMEPLRGLILPLEDTGGEVAAFDAVVDDDHVFKCRKVF